MFRQSSIKTNLYIRGEMLRLIRHFFHDHGYLEVETPIRIPAPAPEAYIDPVPSDGWFLQTSPELCMKELVAAGYDKIFQICKAFRHNERGHKHLPEMTMLEWYTQGDTYLDLMDQCEALIKHIAIHLTKNNRLTYQGKEILLAGVWDRLTVADAFTTFAGVSVEKAMKDDRFDEIMGLEIEPYLGHEKPLFLTDYPARYAALSRIKKEEPDKAERFELYISGIELCNGFTELNDPTEQRIRFDQDQSIRQTNGLTTWPLPENFLNIIGDMPDTAGIAMGVDRLAMLFADKSSIDNVVAFTPEDLDGV